MLNILLGYYIIYILALFYISIIGFVYFIPSIYAFLFNSQENKIIIFIINLLTGWTIIGWLIALAWAFNGNKKNKNAT